MMADEDVIDYQATLINKGIPADVLQLALQEGASLERIFLNLPVGPFGPKKSLCRIQSVWQLLILGKQDFDFQTMEDSFWSKTDPWGATPVHYLALSGHVTGLKWIKEAHPNLLNAKDIGGRHIGHYAALGGNLLAYHWIINLFPRLLNINDDYGRSVSHFAANAYRPNLLAWLKITYPNLLTLKDNNGLTIAHYAAWSISPLLIDWVKTNEPALMKAKDQDGATCYHHAIKAGNHSLIYWLNKENYPLKTYEKDNIGRTFAHYAACSSNPHMLQWIKDNHPSLLSTHTNQDANIAHYAAWSGEIALLQWIKNNHPHLLKKKTERGEYISHCGANSDEIAPLQWVKDNFPALMHKKTKNGANIAHIIAKSATNSKMMQWVIDFYPKLVTQKDKSGCTIIHYAARSKQATILIFLMKEYPELTKQLWIEDIYGDPPQQAYRTDMHINPNKIQNEQLIQATRRYIDVHPEPNDARFLHTFKSEWKHMLFQSGAFKPEEMENTMHHFPTSLQKFIKNLLPTMKLYAYPTYEIILDRHAIYDLLMLTRVISTAEAGTFFTSTAPHPFMRELMQFLHKLKEETLDTKEMLCLQVICEDYERGLLGAKNQANNVLINKLFTTTTLSQLRPKGDTGSTEDMKKEDFPIHLEILHVRINALPLSKEVRKAMQKIILPGVAMIIYNEQDIINHVTTQFGKLYYLQEKLPLHTDHIQHTDGEAYRQFLERLMKNFFGAAEIAFQTGRLSVFCEKLSIGYCFEGRVQDAFKWAASLSELTSFHDLMDRFLNKEYLPYVEVMQNLIPDSVHMILPVSNFIIRRHRHMPCLSDPIYAPEGVITESGVRKYLKNILCYEKEASVFKRLRAILGD